MTRFSVIIPAYNAGNTIQQTIQSCINQSFEAYEIIVIDDCSTDATTQIIAESFSNHIIQIVKLDTNKGVSNARNLGWDLAKGDYVAFLDADDVWHVDKLKIMHQIIADTGLKCLGNAYTDNEQLLSAANEATVIENLTFKKLLLRNYFNTSCLVIEKALGFRFNENMRYTEDHELLLRISKKHKVGFVKSNLTLLGRPQLSKGGLSGNKLKMRAGEVKMYISAAKSSTAVALLLPFLITFSVVKHLKKIFR